ncbi:MAG TPA: amidohydrolase family protein [Clostridia bacterium]|nr:amidohydrolase family protein [Clostridia bacterium]
MIRIAARHLFDGHRIMTDAIVTIDGPRVVSVETPDRNGGFCDYSAAWVTPGLIDLDSGIGLKEESLGFEGNDLNEATEAVTPEMQALDGLSPYDTSLGKSLMGGVTAALVMPGGSNVVGGRGAVVHMAGATADGMCIKAPFGTKFSLGSVPKQTHGQKRTPMTRMGNAFLIRDVLTKARDHREKKKEYNMKYEALLPLLAGEDVAFIQALRADDIMTAVRLAEEFGLRYVVTGAFDADLVADQLKAKDVAVAFGPVIMSRSTDEIRRLHPENAVALLDTGVRTAIISGHPSYPAKYLRVSLGLLVGRRVSPEQALGSVTSVPARLLGLDGYGELQPGSVADLAMFRAEPWEPEGITERTFISGSEVYARS